MVRGGIRGGRGNMRGAGGARGGHFKKAFIPRHPFDLTLAEVVFPKVGPAPDDSALTSVSTLPWVIYRCLISFEYLNVGSAKT